MFLAFAGISLTKQDVTQLKKILVWNNMENQHKSNLTRGAFWASAGFYGLIAFEFFYMFSPFAVYLYGVYSPVLDLLAFSESTSWLIAFFMPHIARETTSFLITWHEWIGMTLFMGGLSAFLVGAGQVYWNKLKKRGAVVKGIYRNIRHPQYLALMISSFGMVLIWPRYLVMFGFVTICCAYYLLARLEEKICLKSFPEYDAYRERTGMFLPRGFERWFQWVPRSTGRSVKVLIGLPLFAVLMVITFWGARMVQSYSVNSLYTWTTPHEVYLSVGALDDREFQELIGIAKSDSEVTEALAMYETSGNRFINYVMPTDLYISEVAMHIPEGKTPSHRPPHLEDQSRYKIIFTLAEFGPYAPVEGVEILKQAYNKSSFLEVWIDRSAGQVEQVRDVPVKNIYDGMPVPIF